jgi:hypothetical protein
MSPTKLIFPHQTQIKLAEKMDQKVKLSPLAAFIKPEPIITSTELEKYLNEKYAKAG